MVHFCMKELLMILFFLYTKDCGKRYKNRQGLSYHTMHHHHDKEQEMEEAAAAPPPTNNSEGE